jgi:hypothetical protein
MAADSFENIVRVLLEAEGFWVQQSYKVELPQSIKIQLGKPTMPRVEIDILAFDQSRNLVNVIEVKSYLDSTGVRLSDLNQTSNTPTGRYKLFTCPAYESAVLSQLRVQLQATGMVNQNTRFRLGLVFGKIYAGHAVAIARHARAKRWFFWSSRAVNRKLSRQVTRQYENDPAIIAAKVLLR